MFVCMVPKMYSVFNLYVTLDRHHRFSTFWLSRSDVAMNVCRGDICVYAITFHNNRLKYLIYVFYIVFGVLF